jgi:hypothetical protein
MPASVAQARIYEPMTEGNTILYHPTGRFAFGKPAETAGLSGFPQFMTVS